MMLVLFISFWPILFAHNKHVYCVKYLSMWRRFVSELILHEAAGLFKGQFTTAQVGEVERRSW